MTLSELAAEMTVPDPYDPRWEMALGERFALIGAVASRRPRIAIEIGTSRGGSLQHIAHWSERVYTFDRDHSLVAGSVPHNAELVTGDSHDRLPALLDELAERGEEVDFALVDGDHSARGAFLDLAALLASPAVRDALILVHDTSNPWVAKGIERALEGQPPHIAHVALDAVSGRARKAPLMCDRWGGLGVVRIKRDVENYRIFDESIRTEPVAGILDHAMHAGFLPARRVARVGRALRKRVAARLP